MLIQTGTQAQFIAEIPAEAGSVSKQGSVDSDALLVSLWVNSLSSGTLTVSVFTLTDEGKETLLFTFPVLSAPTGELLLKKSAVTLQRFRVQVDYTGACSYEIYVRAIANAGESSSRILGSDNWRVSQEDVTTSPGVLIPSSLTDRNGLLIKNWSQSATVYIAESLVKATTTDGYPLGPRDAVAMDIAAGAEVYAVTDTGTADVRIAESGA